MADFYASLTPIVVPSLASSSADALAQFQAQFASNIVNTGNSLLAAYIAQKDTDFFSVGDITEFPAQNFAVDNEWLLRAKERPPELTVDLSGLATKVDQLAALVAPTAPTLVTPDAVIPSLDAAAPTIVMPVAPSTDVGPAPTGAPSLENAPTPDAPVIAIPSAPTLEDLQLPSPPAYVLPEWSAVAPQNLLTPPTTAFSYVDPGYASPLHDRLVLKLLADLDNGTYGIEPADETALFYRARDRAAQAARAAVQDAMRNAASTSFPMPPGFAFEAAQQAEQKAQQSISDANRDIMLKRSDMYVEGRKFTFQQVQSYEKIRIDLYNATQERALNYAKAVVETGIAIYDAGVRNFATKLESYKTEAQVFETRVRAELAKAQVFEAQVKAESLRVDFNKARIDAYVAQLQGISTVVELYKSRIGAAKLFMDLQGQRLDLFRAQVQTYAERVKAKEAEYSVYKAQIAGQLANLDVYRAQIDAHNAQLGAVEARARIQLQGNESRLQSYRVATQQYASQLESFSRQISAKIEEAKTGGALYISEVEAYKALTDTALSAARVNVAQNSQVLDANKTTLMSRIAKVDHRFRQLTSSVELQKDVNKNGIEFLRTALGAATSGLNALGVKTEEG